MALKSVIIWSLRFSRLYILIFLPLTNKNKKIQKVWYNRIGDSMKETDLNIDDIFGGSYEPDYSLLDRTSPSYKEASLVNNVIRESLARKDDDPLTKALQEAAHLDTVTKDRFVNLATLYLDNMQENIFSNQFQLNESYPEISVDEWNDFLNDKIVSVYINKHKRTLLKTAAEDNLANPFAKNKRDNLKLIENIKAEEQSESNKNIVIIRIPDIYEATE